MRSHRLGDGPSWRTPRAPGALVPFVSLTVFRVDDRDDLGSHGGDARSTSVLARIPFTLDGDPGTAGRGRVLSFPFRIRNLLAHDAKLCKRGASPLARPLGRFDVHVGRCEDCGAGP